jgi:hypothetical protein
MTLVERAVRWMAPKARRANCYFVPSVYVALRMAASRRAGDGKPGRKGKA